MSELTKGIDWKLVKARLRKSQLGLEKALAPDPERTAAVFRERAAQLASRGTGMGPGRELLRVMTFLVGAERYGVEFADVRELLPFTCCTPLPGAPAALLGVINLHGEFQSVVDLGRLMEFPGPDVPAAGYVLLLCKGPNRAALRVDGLDKAELMAVTDLTASDPAEARFVRGLAADRTRLLSTDAILAHPLF
jgi:chemotaxis signal transduction protein